MFAKSQQEFCLDHTNICLEYAPKIRILVKEEEISSFFYKYFVK